MEELTWRSVGRDSLTETLFGLSPFGAVGTVLSSPVGSEMGVASVGFRMGSRGVYIPPSVVVLPDKSANDLFAWMKVYSPETSPISQFSRVMLSSDYQTFQLSRLPRSSEVARTDRWSCVVLGEVLAQGDSELEIQTVPLARSSACFSAAVARALIVYGDFEVTRTCTNRLRAFESDSRFVRRPVTISHLLPAWKILETEDDEPMAPVDAAMHVLNAFLFNANSPVVSNRRGSGLDDYPGLFSDSVEDRVVTFHRLATEAGSITHSGEENQVLAVHLAVAAFLVGRGTSHVFLLRKYAKALPSTFVWFGTVAAFAGARSWDVQWSRAVKGIERTLRAKFDWSDPPIVDLCWAEFVWIAENRKMQDPFNDIPKISPKVLSIEVLPGVSCQFRLAAAALGQQDNAVAANVAVAAQAEVQAMLATIVNLASKSRQLLQPGHVESKPLQQSFDLGVAPAYKNARPKKSKPREQ